jgi:hypothetical protein
MTTAKRILMVPLHKPVEALRMASGLTLLDDQVAVACWEALPEGPETDEQVEALDFADVPIERLGHDADALAARILNSDVVFVV